MLSTFMQVGCQPRRRLHLGCVRASERASERASVRACVRACVCVRMCDFTFKKVSIT